MPLKDIHINRISAQLGIRPQRSSSKIPKLASVIVCCTLAFGLTACQSGSSPSQPPNSASTPSTTATTTPSIGANSSTTPSTNSSETLDVQPVDPQTNSNPSTTGTDQDVPTLSITDTNQLAIEEHAGSGDSQGIKYFVATALPMLGSDNVPQAVKLIIRNGHLCILNNNRPQGLVVHDAIKLENGKLISSTGQSVRIGQLTDFKDFGVPEYASSRPELAPVQNACNPGQANTTDSVLLIHP